MRVEDDDQNLAVTQDTQLVSLFHKAELSLGESHLKSRIILFYSLSNIIRIQDVPVCSFRLISWWSVSFFGPSSQMASGFSLLTCCEDFDWIVTIKLKTDAGVYVPNFSCLTFQDKVQKSTPGDLFCQIFVFASQSPGINNWIFFDKVHFCKFSFYKISLCVHLIEYFILIVRFLRQKNKILSC